MQRSTTLVARQPWWRAGIPDIPVPIPVEEESVCSVVQQDNVCETVTENAAMTGKVKVLNSEESARRDYFSSRVNGREYAYEERTRYFNGLGFDIVIFDSKGMYWRIPYDRSSITGTFTIACRITASVGVTVNSKSSSGAIKDILTERVVDKAITAGWKHLGGIHDRKVCEWESLVYCEEFGHEDTLYLSELNLFITKITNYHDAPYHPDAIAKIEGRSYGKGITFGAFVNWNDGDRPSQYYVRIAERTRTLPLIRNHQLPTGVYRFIRDGDKSVVPVLVKDSDLGVTKFWHEIPIFKTSIEADKATSQNIIGQMEMDALEKEKELLENLDSKFGEEKEKLLQDNIELQNKIRMHTLETAHEKKELDLTLFKIKEESAIRNDRREDTSSWLKLVTGAVTVGLGLWKVFS